MLEDQKGRPHYENYCIITILQVSLVDFVTIKIICNNCNIESSFSCNKQLFHKRVCSENYKKFGEAEFLKRYDFKSFIRECIKLYKDPDWTFKGKDKVDQYFDKSVNVKKNESTNSKLKISITHKLKVGHTRFLAGFS